MKTLQKEYLIIGAGPAGVQLGYDMERNKEDYVILERGDTACMFFRQYPRRRTLISINKVYTGYDDPAMNLRWDWNSLVTEDFGKLFKEYSQEYYPQADDLVTYINDFVKHYNIQIQYNTAATHITKNQEGHFVVHTSTGITYVAKAVILATGVPKPFVPDIPGIEHTINYKDYCYDDEYNKRFINKRVLVVGKGNSAFETADNLISRACLIHMISPNSIKFAWQTHHAGHLRALNNNFLDTYQLKAQNALINGDLLGITKLENGKLRALIHYANADGEVEELDYDEIIQCTGFRFDTSVFDNEIVPQLTYENRFPEMTGAFESVNVNDLYFAGTLTQSLDFKKHTSAFIHGYRYNARCLYKILKERYDDKVYPHVEIENTPEALSAKVFERVNSSHSLWQQFGFLGDVAEVDHERNVIRYYDTVPRDYAKKLRFNSSSQWYYISLEFGAMQMEPFNYERPHKDNIAAASESPSIHPIFREYNGDDLVEEFHVIEDFESEWKEEVHTKPALEFFTRSLKATAEVASAEVTSAEVTSAEVASTTVAA